MHTNSKVLKKANHIRITLNSMDLYGVEFITLAKLTPVNLAKWVDLSEEELNRKMKRNVKIFNGVYCDQLVELFEEHTIEPFDDFEAEWMKDIEEGRTTRDIEAEKLLLGKMVVSPEMKKPHPVSIRIADADLEGIQIRGRQSWNAISDID